MVIVATRPFERVRDTYFNDDAFAALTYALYQRPKMGVVIPGTGGVRKVRWRLPGHGKRGGVRVIYYVENVHETIYLLTVYGKSETADLPRELLRKMREVIDYG